MNMQRRRALPEIAAIATLGLYAPLALAQEAEGPFKAGEPLSAVVDGEIVPMSDNVQVFGTIVSAESCMYDATRDLIVAVNRGAPQTQTENDAYVSLINHDGTVHTPKWIGATRDGLTLNQPLGSDIVNGTLYLADSDGGTSETDTPVAVLRMFDMTTGAPTGEIRVEASTGFNDIAVTAEGVVYATQTGAMGDNPDMTTWRVFKVSPDGASEVLIEGSPLARPNGIAFDGDGNLVVVNIMSDEVLTFSPAGELLRTQNAVQTGNDGIIIMPDGVKYVSSVRLGGVSRIPPDGEAELIASGIPSPASMCYDPTANQLVIPMNANNALAFIKL